MDCGVVAQSRRDEDPIVLTRVPPVDNHSAIHRRFENSRDEFWSDFDDDNGTSRLDVLWQTDIAGMARSTK